MMLYSAVNFGKQVIDSVVDFGRNVVNKVTSFFTGSGSQTDARRTRTSSTSAGSGKGVLTANSTVKRIRPAAGYQSTMKCNATLAVRAVGDIVEDIWDFIGFDETDMIMFQTGVTTGVAVATIASPLVAAAVAIVISKGDDISKLLIKAIGRGTVKSVKSFDSLPSNAKNMYQKYNATGWKGNVSGQTSGTAAGSKYRNRDGKLPSTDSSGNPITYKEYDVNNKLPNTNRDGERFVRGSDGSVYYTNNHYTTFTKIE